MPEQPGTDRRPKGITRVGLWISLSVLAAVALLLAILFYQLVRPLALPLFFAAVVAMLVQPIHRRIDAWRRGPAWLSAAVVTVCSLVAIVGPLVAISYLGFVKLHDAVAALDAKDSEASTSTTLPWLADGRLDGLLARVSENLGADPERLRTALAGSINDLEQTLFTRSLQVLGSIPRVLLSIVLFVVAVFFLLKDGKEWRKRGMHSRPWILCMIRRSVTNSARSSAAWFGEPSPQPWRRHWRLALGFSSSTPFLASVPRPGRSSSRY